MKEFSNDNMPLVTILVVTYNSSKYILETLESAKLQNYQNIELIVTDDCSTDLTVDICANWIKTNRQRFVRVELITTEKNTGIPANINRGYRASKAQWVKAIAGDDALLPSCIEDNIDYVMKNPGARIVQSIAMSYKDNFSSENFIEMMDMSNRLNFSDKLTANDQYEMLLRESLVVAPTAFINIGLMKSIGYSDESIPYIEDWPIWLKITRAGEKIHFLNTATVLYRVHSESIQNKKESKFLYNDYILKQRPIYLKYVNNYITTTELIINEIHFYYGKFILKYFNRNAAINRFIFMGSMRVLEKLINIYINQFIYSRIRKKILSLSGD
jgi:glycosyltransferase involved in cell wall biosynthesis